MMGVVMNGEVETWWWWGPMVAVVLLKFRKWLEINTEVKGMKALIIRDGGIIAVAMLCPV